ncbi:MAG: DUF4157 domain-containing protein [Paludibacteraceae bacterium]|nr:DUF4157 domain-containing protein [Paludibacteraceae bacterium]
MKAKIDQAKNSHRNLSIKSKKGVGLPSQSSTVVQAQLETTTPGDAYEQEADRMADMVMRKIDGANTSEAKPSNHCPTPTISCFGGTSMPISSEMESQLQAMQGGGHAMPEGLRAQMEGSFGHNFSNVRLHTDSAAADMSSSINAKAFTHGNDIYFNQGQFQPNTPAGQHLIAHELTHTVQQGGKVAREESENKEDDEVSSLILKIIDLLSLMSSSVDLFKEYKVLNDATYELPEFLKAIQNSKITKGVNIISYLHSLYDLIKKANSYFKTSKIAGTYYLIRFFACLVDGCPVKLPIPANVKIVLTTFNLASSIGDMIADPVCNAIDDYFDKKSNLEVASHLKETGMRGYSFENDLTLELIKAKSKYHQEVDINRVQALSFYIVDDMKNSGISSFKKKLRFGHSIAVWFDGQIFHQSIEITEEQRTIIKEITSDFDESNINEKHFLSSLEKIKEPHKDIEFLINKVPIIIEDYIQLGEDNFLDKVKNNELIWYGDKTGKIYISDSQKKILISAMKKINLL